LQSEIVTTANVQPADKPDAESIKNTVIDAQANLKEASDAAEFGGVPPTRATTGARRSLGARSVV
jgi:hypothetical protein